MAYHRTFIAINLPQKAKNIIAETISDWQNLLADQIELPIKWTLGANLHLTLVFLGNITDDDILIIGKKITQIAASTEPFYLHFTNFVYGPKDFVKTDMPHMIWLEGEENPKLIALQNELEKAFEMGGQKKKFTPHITIGRIKTSSKAEINKFPKTFNKKCEITVPVSSIEFMESELRPGRPQYTVLLSASFNI